jgi:hypothetical protein
MRRMANACMLRGDQSVLRVEGSVDDGSSLECHMKSRGKDYLMQVPTLNVQGLNFVPNFRVT